VDLLREGLLDVGVVRHPGVLDGLTAGPVLVLPTALVLPEATVLPEARGRAGGGPAGVPGACRGLGGLPLPVAVPPRRHHAAARGAALSAAGWAAGVVAAAAGSTALGGPDGSAPAQLPPGPPAPRARRAPAQRPPSARSRPRRRVRGARGRAGDGRRSRGCR